MRERGGERKGGERKGDVNRIIVINYYNKLL